VHANTTRTAVDQVYSSKLKRSSMETQGNRRVGWGDTARDHIQPPLKAGSELPIASFTPYDDLHGVAYLEG
jgi:hypothetical protein